MQAVYDRKKRGLRHFLREALAGTSQDFTQGSLSRGIALLALPTMLEMAMESTFAIVDAFWVARLGTDAVAAVGITEAMVILVFSIGIGLSMAAGAMVARRIGEHDPEGAAVAAAQAIAAGVAISAVTGTLGAVFAPRLLALMDASPAVIATGARFSRIVLGANGCIILLFLINGIFRGAGDAVLSMRTLWLANLVNLALDPCFIYGLWRFPRLGVTGAAVATTTGRSIGVLFQLFLLWQGRGRVKLRRRHLRIHWPVLRPLLRVAATAIAQYFIATASWLGLARLNAAFGSAAVAGYTLAIRVITFFILPSWGISAAVATLVGQNLGARQPERAERAVWLAGRYNMAFLTAVGVGVFAFAGPLASLFSNDPEVRRITATCLRFISAGYPCYAWGMTMEQAFNGAGDSTTPTWLNLGCYWMLQIPLASVLSMATPLGARGVYAAIAGAETVLAAAGVTMFRRGRWKTVKL
ncbi:MAG TPA: MATE family efflux transporter [Bryobacteraceae bacterium]|jgi:putative MATE family efflux protein|nr:MATE family efflux transporter [Bryobacteraceae bacterium]